jgi:hypothetical protein
MPTTRALGTSSAGRRGAAVHKKMAMNAVYAEFIEIPEAGHSTNIAQRLPFNDDCL